jgi:hypothetical protein
MGRPNNDARPRARAIPAERVPRRLVVTSGHS